jgi:aflatoxin B1 aldehyde reductase
MFRRFGLSGYLASDVELIHAFCTTNKYVLPTVYQGCYNPVARHCEIELMPTLRRLGISFYAYAPSGGGLLAKTKQEVKEGKGRFDSSSRGGQVLRFLYCRPAILHSLDEWNHIAVAAGCSGNELAIRWVRFNSALSVMYDDAVVWSCSTIEQLQETLVAIEKGPLDQEISRRIDSIWELVKNEAPLDNTNG